MRWVVEPEYISLLVLTILIVYNAKTQTPKPSLNTRLFAMCLYVSFLAIISNIVSVYTVENARSLPLSLNEVANTIYFALTSISLVLVAIYLYSVIYRQSPEKAGFKRSLIASLVLLALYLILVAFNYRTGWFFYFDENLNYCRGILNRYMIVFYLCYAVIGIIAFIDEKKNLDRSFYNVIFLVLPVSAVLGLIQTLKAQVMLTGTAFMCVLLILFIYFQQQKNDTDNLTALANRETFFQTVEAFIKVKKNITVTVISLRNFKQINYRFGQRNGDMFLKQIAVYLQNILPDAVICRYSGVEFGLIFHDADEKTYEKHICLLRSRFKEPWSHNGLSAFISANIADINYPQYASNVNELITALEYAVRVCKYSEESRYLHYNSTLREELNRRNYLIDELKYAVAKKTFFLNYQPIYDVKRNKFLHAEVLLRLRDRKGEYISPSEFIPLAEENGMIVEMSWMLVEKVCSFFKDNASLPIDSISINMSQQQFTEHDAVSRFCGILEENGVSSEKIKVEITERTISEDSQRVIAVMNELISRGVGFYLDDFGTGYSNLATATMLPFECVKIDKSLSDKIVTDETGRKFLSSFVAALKFVTAEIIAEGIETEEQLKIAKEIGIDHIQGFYFSKPMEERDYINFVTERNA